MEKDNKIELARYITDLRKKNKITQKQMAEKLDVSQPYYSQIEKGFHEIHEDRLARITDILGTSNAQIIKNLQDADTKEKKHLGKTLLGDSTSDEYLNKETARTIEDLKKRNEYLEKQNYQLNNLLKLSDQSVGMLEKYVQSFLNTIDVNQKTIEQLHQIISNASILHERIMAHNEQLRQYCNQALDETEKMGYESVKKLSPNLSREEFLGAIATQRKILGLDINYEDYSNNLKKFGESVQKTTSLLNEIKQKVDDKIDKPMKNM